jgi:hypothetical protein
MNFRRVLSIAALAAATCTLPACAQTSHPKPDTTAQVSAHPQADPTDKVYPMDQIVTATVHDAWVLSGKNEEAFFDIVEQLAQFSAQKRGIELPNTAAAGRRMGLMIKTRAQADHDQLLYAIVDQAVRSLVKPAAKTPSKADGK